MRRRLTMAPRAKTSRFVLWCARPTNCLVRRRNEVEDKIVELMVAVRKDDRACPGHSDRGSLPPRRPNEFHADAACSQHVEQGLRQTATHTNEATATPMGRVEDHAAAGDQDSVEVAPSATPRCGAVLRLRCGVVIGDRRQSPEPSEPDINPHLSRIPLKDDKWPGHMDPSPCLGGERSATSKTMAPCVTAHDATLP